MLPSPDPSTGTTLHLLLRDPANPECWKAFVERYGPKVYGWCRKWRLQEADAENVTQDVLTRLVQRMHNFDPDKSFRAWLKKVTENALIDYVNAQKRAIKGSGDSGVLEQLHTVAAREDLARELEGAWEGELLDQAQALVRLQVTPRDWMIFTGLAVEGRAGRDVAAEHQMSVAAAFMVRSRVQKKLREAIGQLEGPPVDNPGSPP